MRPQLDRVQRRPLRGRLGPGALHLHTARQHLLSHPSAIYCRQGVHARVLFQLELFVVTGVFVCLWVGV